MSPHQENFNHLLRRPIWRDFEGVFAVFVRLIASLCIVVMSSGAFAQSRVVRVVVDEWAPFGGVSLPNGGISLDVIGSVLERAGYQIETSIVPWERAIEGTKSGDYDVIGNLFHLPELEEFLTYSAPFYESNVQFVQRAGADFAISDLDSLRPYSIAVGAGYFYEDRFDQADFLQKTEVTTVAHGVRMVAGGRIDLTLDSVDVINHLIHSAEPELANQVEVLPTVLATQNIHMAVRNSLADAENLLADFNNTLTEMRADGTLDDLLAKHRY